MFKSRHVLIGLASAVALMAGAPAQAGSTPFMPRGEITGAPSGFAELCRRDVVTCGVPEGQLAFLGAAPALTPTSSIGSPPQPLLAAPSPAALDYTDDLHLAKVETLQAWRPAPVEDLRAAGDLRPRTLAVSVQPYARPAAVSNAWETRSPREQLKLLNQINQLVNRTVKRATDQELYGATEYWALPRLVGGKLYGDCEDFALEKRRRLIEAGVPDSALSMTVAFTARGESHAVLMVSLGDGDWVLDNLTPWATPWRALNYKWVERQIPGTAFWTAA